MPLALCAGAALVSAQIAPPAPTPTPQAGDQAPPISGRDFAGVRLAVSPQSGDIILEASRASVWTEEPAVIPGALADMTLGAGVQRVLLRGDVRVSLGIYRFAAARAVVWIERLEPSKTKPGQFINQVAVYFDRVSDPEAGGAPGVPGGPGVAQSGDRLMVTGLIDGDLTLRADSLASGRPAVDNADPLLAEGEGRMQRLLTDLTAPAVPTGIPPAWEQHQTAGVRPPTGSPAKLVPGMSQPFEPDSPLSREQVALPPSALDLPPAERTPPIFASTGIFTFAVGQATMVADGDASAVIVTPASQGAGVVVQYSDTRRDRQLELSAERAVVFLAPGPASELGRLSADKVRGIYLEGNVIASDGRFTLRGPQVYYDVTNNRAFLVDAVFWTYDARRGLPLYVRAKSLMQSASNQVTGEGVTLANSSFFQPHLSLGATSITITREQTAGPDGALAARTVVDGRDLTLRAGTFPFFYFPRFAGDVERFPLRDVRLENSSDSGFAVKTSWNLFGLFGVDSPPGVRLDLLVDGYSLRGPALGLEGRYDLGSQSGDILAYLVPDDRGRDTLTSGSRKDRDGQTRGIFLADHRWSIDERWSVFFEGAYVSDENFVDALYEPIAETRRELATSVYARRLDANSSFSALAKGNLNDFIANEYLLQSQGYTVQKLPEIDYARVADSLFGGALLWTSDYRFSNMALAFEKKTPAELGFDTPFLSNAAFGLAPGARIDDALRASGLFQSSVLRFDTRHELSAKLDVGPIRISPFGVGRFTAYDNKFDAFSPTQDDEHRYWAGGGVRAATSVQHVNDSIDSRLFDIHRTRHILEPSVTAFAAGTNVESSDLPIYDESVEGIADGSAVKVGLAQTWQTQRGGEGRWRSVDFFKLNTELVYSSNDAPIKSPIGRFFDYRPEFSTLGDFANIDAAWQVTDAVGLTASEIYDLDNHQSSRTSAGGTIQHSRDFSTFAEVHFLNARNSTFVSMGADYRLTRKWTVGVAATYDVDQTDFQELGARLNREFPSALVSVKIKYNNITDEVAFGFVLQPKFADDRLVQLRRLGRDQMDLGEVPEDAVRPSGRTPSASGWMGSDNALPPPAPSTGKGDLP